MNLSQKIVGRRKTRTTEDKEHSEEKIWCGDIILISWIPVKRIQVCFYKDRLALNIRVLVS